MTNQNVLTKDHWLQIELAAMGCIGGTSDEWPLLRQAIERLTGERMIRRSADWLNGFCKAVMLLRESHVPVLKQLLPDWHADADDLEAFHGGDVICEMTFKDVRDIKMLLKILGSLPDEQGEK